MAPTAVFANNGPVTAGATATVAFSGQTDPSSADVAAGFTYSYDFDNNGTFEVTGSASASATVPASYLATAGSHVVHGRITDKDSGFTDYTTSITVNAAIPPVRRDLREWRVGNRAARGRFPSPTRPAAAAATLTVTTSTTITPSR